MERRWAVAFCWDPALQGFTQCMSRPQTQAPPLRTTPQQTLSSRFHPTLYSPHIPGALSQLTSSLQTSYHLFQASLLRSPIFSALFSSKRSHPLKNPRSVEGHASVLPTLKAGSSTVPVPFYLASKLVFRPWPYWRQATPLQTLGRASCRSLLWSRPNHRTRPSCPTSPTRHRRAQNRAAAPGVSPITAGGSDSGGQLGDVPGRIRT